MTTVRLALGGGRERFCRALEICPEPVALLCSYYYLECMFHKAKWNLRSWALDSGAFSAMNVGAEIDLGKYCDKIEELRDNDNKLEEVFALDVIGDWRQGLRNVQKMWARGIEATPCYHYGEPEDVLMGMAKDYPRIAIGGAARLHKDRKRNFALSCVSRVWPKRVHGFGFHSESLLSEVPFYSADATTWQLMPFRFGEWKSRDADFRPRDFKSVSLNMIDEVIVWLEMEKKLKARWKNEMEELEYDASKC